jgi:hypothetical protein
VPPASHYGIPLCCCASSGLHPPAQHIAETWNSAEFYANKLLKDFRGVDDRQVAWARGLKVSSTRVWNLPAFGTGRHQLQNQQGRGRANTPQGSVKVDDRQVALGKGLKVDEQTRLMWGKSTQGSGFKGQGSG